MLQVNDIGRNNKIIFDDKLNACDLRIRVTGDNNSIEISSGSIVNGEILIESNNSSIQIASAVRFHGKIFMKGAGSNVVSIGEKTTVGGMAIICSEGTRTKIGSECMISFDVEARTTDSHAIFDLESNKRINFASDITIEDHVWIAAHAKLLKGTKIPKGSIVGFSSVVTKAFAVPNVAIAGNPAKIIKTGVYWDRKLLG